MEKYEVLSVLGKGGCGKVVLAKEKESGKLFAIKEIVLDPKKKTRTKEAVAKEARILAHLKHPHVVGLLDSFFDPPEEQLYLVQDFCDGGTLYDQILQTKEKDAFLPEKQVMHWFVQLAMALQYIHSRKVLHRDLKSQNVFLTKKGVVKLGDFGIARMMENTLDMAQTCCGTPCYLSPELCQDLPYSSKADVWALGCLLFEMCALRYAFDASNFMSLFYKIVKVDHGEIPERYSSSLRELIKLTLAKSPEDRPTAGAILNFPYVQESLALFIKEKENLQEALHAKQLLKTKEQRTKSPASPRPSSAQAGAKLEISCARARCKSAQPRSTKTSGQPSPTETENTGTPPKETDDGGTYSDDFDESSGEEYSDDFEEEPSMNESLKRPLSSLTNSAENGNAGNGQDVEYADDFEQDSDCEEIIEDILENARAAQDAEMDETVVEDEEGHACRQKLKEHVMEALGMEMFEKVRDSLGRAGKDRASENGPDLENLEGSALLETCYLVNELFLEGE